MAKIKIKKWLKWISQIFYTLKNQKNTLLIKKTYISQNILTKPNFLVILKTIKKWYNISKSNYFFEIFFLLILTFLFFIDPKINVFNDYDCLLNLFGWFIVQTKINNHLKFNIFLNKFLYLNNQFYNYLLNFNNSLQNNYTKNSFWFWLLNFLKFGCTYFFIKTTFNIFVEITYFWEIKLNSLMQKTKEKKTFFMHLEKFKNILINASKRLFSMGLNALSALFTVCKLIKSFFFGTFMEDFKTIILIYISNKVFSFGFDLVNIHKKFILQFIKLEIQQLNYFFINDTILFGKSTNSINWKYTWFFFKIVLLFLFFIIVFRSSFAFLFFELRSYLKIPLNLIFIEQSTKIISPLILMPALNNPFSPLNIAQQMLKTHLQPNAPQENPTNRNFSIINHNTHHCHMYRPFIIHDLNWARCLDHNSAQFIGLLRAKGYTNITLAFTITSKPSVDSKQNIFLGTTSHLTDPTKKEMVDQYIMASPSLCISKAESYTQMINKKNSFPKNKAALKELDEALDKKLITNQLPMEPFQQVFRFGPNANIEHIFLSEIHSKLLEVPDHFFTYDETSENYTINHEKILAHFSENGFFLYHPKTKTLFWSNVEQTDFKQITDQSIEMRQIRRKIDKLYTNGEMQTYKLLQNDNHHKQIYGGHSANATHGVLITNRDTINTTMTQLQTDTIKKESKDLNLTDQATRNIRIKMNWIDVSFEQENKQTQINEVPNTVKALYEKHDIEINAETKKELFQKGAVGQYISELQKQVSVSKPAIKKIQIESTTQKNTDIINSSAEEE